MPPFVYGVGGQQLGEVFYAREGEKVGTFYGGIMAIELRQPPGRRTSCDGFEVNDDGLLVWTGGPGLRQPAVGDERPGGGRQHGEVGHALRRLLHRQVHG